MAVEFGAKLYLKDNMYATLKKNMELQKSYSQQINDTSSSISKLGKQKANPVITAHDKATEVLNSVRENIDNLSDVYNAIHAIQENLGVAGTTAMEASETFSGAFAMMKASAKNLLGNLSVGDGKAVARSMGELVESASTFFFGNFIPMLQTIFSNLPTAIGTAVEKVAPQIKENVLPLLTSIKDAIFTGLGNIGIDTGALQAIFDQLFNVKVDGGGIASMFSGLKAGDMVLVQKLNDNNKYVIIARVVEA